MVPHTYFSTKFRTTFNFIEVSTEDKPDTCATLIQNVNEITTLIHNVTHTYHTEIKEVIPQTNY